MQTFLPVPDFLASARLLDDARLGKQRVETLQILRALELPDYGWATHPAVVMWRGRTPALVVYGRAMARVWIERGFADSTDAQIAEFAPELAEATQADLAAAGQVPSWLGEEAVHRSHRANLLAKDDTFYRARFGAEFPNGADNEPYLWPGADDLPPADPPTGTPVWVVRPRAHPELGAALATGVVGLGTQSGVDVDATGLTLTELRGLAHEATGKRPAKDLRQLAALLDEMAPGDPVALPVDGGRGLLVGEVTGNYAFAARELLPHRRPVRFDRVVPRSAVRPPATMQDPRALFRVLVDPAVVPG